MKKTPTTTIEITSRNRNKLQMGDLIDAGYQTGDRVTFSGGRTTGGEVTGILIGARNRGYDCQSLDEFSSRFATEAVLIDEITGKKFRMPIRLVGTISK